MPVDWKAPDSFNRLLAATVASMDGLTKLNYKKIADYYGEGATYDAIEGRFRIIKKQAAKLKEEVKNGRAIAPERGNGNGSGSNKSTPRKQKPTKHSSPDVVMTGRVSKTTTTPTKRRPTHIKMEALESSTTGSTSSAIDDPNTPSSSINYDAGAVIDDSFGYDPNLTSFEMSFNGGCSNNMDPNAGLAFGGGQHAHLDLDSFWDDEHVV